MTNFSNAVFTAEITGKVLSKNPAPSSFVSGLIKKRRMGESGVLNGSAMFVQTYFIVIAAVLSATLNLPGPALMLLPV